MRSNSLGRINNPRMPNNPVEIDVPPSVLEKPPFVKDVLYKLQAVFWVLASLGVGALAVACLFFPKDVKRGLENNDSLTDNADVEFLIRVSGVFLVLSLPGFACQVQRSLGINNMWAKFLMLDVFSLAGVAGVVLFSTQNNLTDEWRLASIITSGVFLGFMVMCGLDELYVCLNKD